MLNKLLYLSLITLISCTDNPSVSVVKYCKIDSISVYDGFKISPDIKYKNYTTCDKFIFTSYHKFNLNDSIQLKIIKWDK